MDANFAKRNLSLFIYDLLKEHTDSEEKRLSAADIIRIMKEKFEVSIDRKTVYRCINDLKTFGYDICHDQDGYFLGVRTLTYGEFSILVDGIESLSQLSPDEKIEIQEKLCKIIGKPSRELNNFLYDREEEIEDDIGLWAPDNPRKYLEIIAEAIEKNKQLILRDPLYTSPAIFSGQLTVPLSDEETVSLKKKLKKELFLEINPHQIFRSNNNKMMLSFYININGNFHSGVLDFANLINNSLEISDRNIENANVTDLFNYNFTNFESMKQWKEDSRIMTAELTASKGNFDIDYDINNIVSYEKEEKYGQTVYKIKYRESDHETLAAKCMQESTNFKVLPGSELYFDVKRYQEEMSQIYGCDFDDEEFTITKDNENGKLEVIEKVRGFIAAYQSFDNAIKNQRDEIYFANNKTTSWGYSGYTPANPFQAKEKKDPLQSLIDSYANTPAPQKERTIRLFDCYGNEIIAAI